MEIVRSLTTFLQRAFPAKTGGIKGKNFSTDTELATLKNTREKVKNLAKDCFETVKRGSVDSISPSPDSRQSSLSGRVSPSRHPVSDPGNHIFDIAWKNIQRKKIDKPPQDNNIKSQDLFADEDLSELIDRMVHISKCKKAGISDEILKNCHTLIELQTLLGEQRKLDEQIGKVLEECKTSNIPNEQLTQISSTPNTQDKLTKLTELLSRKEKYEDAHKLVQSETEILSNKYKQKPDRYFLELQQKYLNDPSPENKVHFVEYAKHLKFIWECEAIQQESKKNPNPGQTSGFREVPEGSSTYLTWTSGG